MGMRGLCVVFILLYLSFAQHAEGFNVFRGNGRRVFAYANPTFSCAFRNCWMSPYTYSQGSGSSPSPSVEAQSKDGTAEDSLVQNQVLNLKMGNGSIANETVVEDSNLKDVKSELERLNASSMLTDFERLQTDKNMTVADFINILPDLDLNLTEESWLPSMKNKGLEERVQFFKGLQKCTFAFANDSASSTAALPEIPSIERYRSANTYMQKYVNCLSNLTEEMPSNNTFVNIFETLSDGLYQIFNSLSNLSDAASIEQLPNNGSDTATLLENLAMNMDKNGSNSIFDQNSNDNTPLLDTIKPALLEEILQDLPDTNTPNDTIESVTSTDGEAAPQEMPSPFRKVNPGDEGVIIPQDDGDTFVKVSGAINKAEIAGIIVGCFVAMAILLALLGFIVYRKMFVSKLSSSSEDNMLMPLGMSGTNSSQHSLDKLQVLSSFGKGSQISGLSTPRIPEHSKIMDEILVCESSPVQWGLDFNIATDEVSLSEVVGRGAFGVVYKGIWKGKQVAVKVLSLAYGNDEKLLKTFKKEVDVLSRLQHENIVHLYGACFAPPSVFLVEEFIECGSLHDALYKKHCNFHYSQIVLIAMDIANALSYLHPKIVHCDLKPQNILIDNGGHAKVADFGIARFKKGTYMQQTSAATVHGTPAYMSPELFSAGHVTEKCDVYSLGVILWECLARTEPWRELEFPMQVVMAVAVEQRRPPIPESCPPSLARLIKMCWHDNPHRRPSCLELVKECAFILKELEGVDT